MIKKFEYMKKVKLINHDTKWILDKYYDKEVYLKSEMKVGKAKWYYFTADGITVMLGKPSYFGKIN